MSQDNETTEKTTTQEPDRTAELEGLLVARQEELNKANSRITELEQAVAGANQRLSQLDGSLAKAVSSYRTLVVQSQPLLKELVTGDSIEAIDSSLTKARELISKVKSGVESEITSARVPAGAPQRTTGSPQGLSPREKIQQGIGGRH